MPILSKVLNRKGNAPVQESPATAAVLQYNGVYYECCDIPLVLKKAGLPPEITEEMAGIHLSYLKLGEGVDYTESAIQTDIELYTYATSPCRAVYVLRDGENYMAVLFAGFVELGENANVELSELYRVYDAEDSSGLAAICQADLYDEPVTEYELTDRKAIEQFYEQTACLNSYGSEDFKEIRFAGLSAQEITKARGEFQKDCRRVRVTTANGLHYC